MERVWQGFRNMADLNRIETGIIAKLAERFSGAPHMGIQKLFKFHDMTNSGQSNLGQFIRAMEPITGSVSENDLSAIFYRYSNGEDSLDYKTFALKFSSGSVREGPVTPKASSGPLSPDVALSKIRGFLRNCEPTVFLAQASYFRDADPKNTRMVPLSYVDQLINEGPIGGACLSFEELDALVHAFTRPLAPNMTPSFAFDAFVSAIAPALSGAPEAALRYVYSHICNKGGDGLVEISVLTEVYDAANHPLVLRDEATAEDVLRSYLSDLSAAVKWRRSLVDPLTRGVAKNLPGHNGFSAMRAVDELSSVSWEDLCSLYGLLAPCYPTPEHLAHRIEDEFKGVATFLKAKEIFSPARADPTLMPAAGHLAPQRIPCTNQVTDPTRGLVVDTRYRHPKDEAALDPALPFQRAARQASQAGLKACSRLTAGLLEADLNRDGLLTINEFRRWASTAEGLRVTPDEEAALFRQHGVPDQTVTGQLSVLVPVEACLAALWGHLDESSLSVVTALWTDLTRGRTYLPLEEARDAIRADRHPLVTSGKRQAHVVKDDLDMGLAVLSRADPSGAGRRQQVSQATFFTFCQMVACSFDAQPAFRAAIHRIFGRVAPGVQDQTYLQGERQAASRPRVRSPSPNGRRTLNDEETAAVQGGEAVLFSRNATARPDLPRVANMPSEGKVRDVPAGLNPTTNLGGLSVYAQGVDRSQVDVRETVRLTGGDLHMRFRRTFQAEGEVAAVREAMIYRSNVNMGRHGASAANVDSITERTRARLSVSMLIRPFVNLVSQVDKLATAPQLQSAAVDPSRRLHEMGLTRAEFTKLCRASALGLADDEQDLIFKAMPLSGSQTGRMDAYRLLVSLQGELKDERAEWVGRAWQAVTARLGADVLTPQQVVAHMDFGSHPSVLFASSQPQVRSATPVTLAKDDFLQALVFFAHRTLGQEQVDAQVFGDAMHAASAACVRPDEFRLLCLGCFKAETPEETHAVGPSVPYPEDAHGVSYGQTQYQIGERGMKAPIGHYVTQLPHTETLRDEDDILHSLAPQARAGRPVFNPISPKDPLDVSLNPYKVEPPASPFMPGYESLIDTRGRTADFKAAQASAMETLSHNFYLGGEDGRRARPESSRRRSMNHNEVFDKSPESHKFSRYW